MTWINGSLAGPTYARSVINKLVSLALCGAVQLVMAATDRAAEQAATPPTRAATGGETGFKSSFPAAGVLELSFRGQKLLTYACASSQFKPYVRELFTLKGDNVLLDAPPDHLHHHGLMYGIRVNGVNFWEERDAPGYERSVRLDPPKFGRTRDGLPQATFLHLIHWVPSADAPHADTAAAALLVERRTITLAVDEARQEVALTWHADFEAGPAAAKVTLAGANYHGLGLRLPPSFNRTALHRNSEQAPYPTQGKGDVTPARWSAVSHELEGRNVTVALFAPPAPGDNPPLFFTMVQPFTYLSVTQGLDRKPIEHRAGDRFALTYLLAAYPDSRTPEFLQERYTRWLKSLSQE